jgi:hypothetical protein
MQQYPHKRRTSRRILNQAEDFPARFCASFQTRQTQNEIQRGERKGETMNRLIQLRKTTVVFVSVLVFGCFVFLPQMGAAPDEEPSLPESFSGTNTFDGFHALFHQTSNTFNSAFGWASLLTQTTATGVTGCGAATLVLNTADDNTAVGAAALLLNTTGSDNTAVGFQALQANVSGTRNTAVGASAMQTGAAGDDNTAVGELAGNGIIGASNTVLGSGAGTGITSASGDTVIGESAGGNPLVLDDCIYIGHNVGTGFSVVESNTIRIGDNCRPGREQRSVLSVVSCRIWCPRPLALH